MKPHVRRFVRQFVLETAAAPAALARVGDRLSVHVRAAEASRELLAALPAPRVGGERRVQARLASLRRPALRSPFFGVLASAAFGAAITFGLMWLTTGEPTPSALAGDLAAEAWRADAPTEHVGLRYQGTGRVAGTSRAPIIEWSAGLLEVEVEPDRGIDLSVHTPEAEIRVIGTGFSVGRDALGTSVTVAHGRVAVDCGDGSNAVLRAGASHICFPTRAGGLLGRAQGLADRGAAPAEVLQAADRGLAAGAEGAIRAELSLLRVRSLLALGRAVEARAGAESWLAGGDPSRRLEMRHIAAREALLAGGCDAALPHLESLAAAGANAPELVQFADCVATERPDSASAALLKALRLGVPAEQEPGIVRRIKQLQTKESP